MKGLKNFEDLNKGPMWEFLLCKNIIMVNFFFNKWSIFFYQGLLSQTLTVHRTAGKGRDHRLFHSTTSTHSWTLRHLFATLHVRWLSRIFNRNACVYQTATRWDLSIYHFIELPFEWFIDDALFVCLLDELILGYLLQQFGMRNRWILTRIDYHPCITSELTNQVY